MMQGFSDCAPPGWDTAVGTVRGFRWWTLTVPLLTADPELPRAVQYLRDNRPVSPEELYPTWPLASPFRLPEPQIHRCYVQGLHGSEWRHGLSDNGRYQAKCGAPFRYDPAVSRDILNPACGCGFWAYWRNLPLEWDACIPYIRRNEIRSRWLVEADNYYTLAIPLAGVIEGSGKTIIGEKGFRSEYARITDLTLALDSDCLYHDGRQPLLYPRAVSNGGSSPWFLSESGNPRAAGKFFPFVKNELGLPADILVPMITSVAKYILGNGITWHLDVPMLLKNCPPDENYGMPSE